MTVPNWLEPLIDTYVLTARALGRRLGATFQTELLRGRRTGVIPQQGVTADGLEFSFHGAGCRIELNDVVVDFDFLPDGRIGGFDAWRLHLFTTENAGQQPRSQEEVQAALLVSDQVFRVEGWHLFTRIDPVVARFRVMTDAERRNALARFVHELTIAARGAFLEDNFEQARWCNETIHRVSGVLMKTTLEESFVETLTESGWTWELRRAFSLH